MQHVDEMAPYLKAVSDANRLKIISYLKQGELCVCELVKVLGVSQPAVSQQLRKLKELDIVLERRKGTWIHYRLNEAQQPYIQAIIDCLNLPEKESCMTCTDSSTSTELTLSK